MTAREAKTIPAGAISDIIAGLNVVLAPLDAERLVRSQEWAQRRCNALVEFKASEEGQALRNNQWAYYRKLFELSGGKTWYSVFGGGYGPSVADFMVKNCAAAKDKRNWKIAKYLIDAGVTSVTSSTYARTSDGYDGTFTVMTDKGDKTVYVRSIYAGGYNIQCLHIRVLVKVY
jgi:hypothetical protein